MWYFKEKEGDFVRDFKAFATENGVASLVLRQIPYRKTAYVTIRCASDPGALVDECVQFCIAAGAETVYGSGHRLLERHPHFVDILAMKRKTVLQEPAEVKLVPVEVSSLEKWRLLYNIKMEKVSLGTFLDRAGAEELLQEESLYFAYRNDELLGIGSVSGDMIRTVASLRPGAGEQIVQALCSVVDSDTVRLEVASDNKKAINVYEKMGFAPEGDLKSWHILHKKDQA